MARFDFSSPFRLSGRSNLGLRGFTGKPFHPPLTDVPTTAYVIVALFDVISLAVHDGRAEVGLQLYRAATWVLLCGVVVSLLTALTGFLDWRQIPVGTGTRRVANAHGITMVTVTALVLLDLLLRLTVFGDEDYAVPTVVILSAVAAALTTVGAAIGGSLVFEHGVRVERDEG